MVPSEKTGKFRTPRVAYVLSALLFLGTFVVYPIHRDPRHYLGDSGFESLQLAVSLALKGTFADPFLPLPTGPSAHLAPAYPAMVAVLMKAFGIGPSGDYALRWVSVSGLAAQLALLPLLTDYLGLASWTGAFAGVAWLVAKFPLLPWENDFAALVIVGLAFLMYKAFVTKLSGAEVTGAGLLWGLLLLLTPTPLIVLIGWLVALVVSKRQSRWAILLLAIIPFVLVLPWLIRNYEVFHHAVFLRDNLGIELATSNSDCAHYSMALNLGPNGCFAEHHPNASLALAWQVRKLGEPEYNHLRLQEAIAWIRHHPRRFANLTAKRFLAFWFPNATGSFLRGQVFWGVDWTTDLLTLLSIPGLVMIWRKNRQAAILLLLWLILFPPPYYLIQFAPRYRHPVLWATFIAGAYVVVQVLSATRLRLQLRLAPARA